MELGKLRAENSQLQHALVTRPIVDQAIGILRSRTGATVDEATRRLRAMSQDTNVRLTEVAEKLVSEAVRRAAGRRRLH